MITLVYRKILIQFILIGIVITMYDVILHSLFSIVHIAFEWVELGLEKLIEHIFHTSRQQSQIIVFYLLWLIALYGLYRLCRALPDFYNRFKEQLLAACLHYTSYITQYWSEQTSIRKMKWIASITVSLYCLVFFAFS